VTPAIFGNTVGYPSDSLASCLYSLQLPMCLSSCCLGRPSVSCPALAVRLSTDCDIQMMSICNLPTWRQSSHVLSWPYIHLHNRHNRCGYDVPVGLGMEHNIAYARTDYFAVKYTAAFMHARLIYGDIDTIGRRGHSQAMTQQHQHGDDVVTNLTFSLNFHRKPHASCESRD